MKLALVVVLVRWWTR